jgi:cleavage and polyadenylation specificity factor subunit 3
MFLEAQFGSDALNPIEKPKLPSNSLLLSKQSSSPSVMDTEDNIEDQEEDEGAELREIEKVEIERLHKAGIPVPGIEIKVDKMVAKVWLEYLEVECTNRVFGDRVRAVVERAVEVVAPLWG